jgi:DNA-nicking Smr family endonuclease
MKSRRQLSREEHELWGHVTKGVKRLKPLPRKAIVSNTTVERPVEQSAPAHKPAKMKAASVHPAPAHKPPAKPAPKPLVPLEPKTKRRLGRGQVDVAARIDLHGMRQHQAHDALLGFVANAYANDARVVLVITGKGKTASGSTSTEREVGVLRRLAPHWLGEPSLRHMVLGYEPATLRHGGEGAFYVRIRKRGAT